MPYWHEQVYLINGLYDRTNFQEPTLHISHGYLRGAELIWEVDSCLASQEIPHILWNLNVQYHVHKNPSLIPLLSHINPLHILTPYFSKIHFNIILSSMPISPTQSLPSMFSD